MGYKYKINFYTFSKNHKLPHLFNRNPFAIENIKNYLILHNSSLVLISEKYSDSRKKLDFVCKYHKDKGIQEKSLSKIVNRGHGCKYCAYEKLSKCVQINTDVIIQRCKELGIIYVDRYSFKGETWVNYICPEHESKGIQNISWSHLKTCSLKCPYCYGKYKNTEDFINEMKNINRDIEIIGQYNGSENPVKCKCKKCGHIWSPIGRSLKNKQGCPICKSSKGEKAIYDFLIKNNIDFIKEKKFEDCKNKRCLKFDFYLPLHNLCIEYDGEQHFMPVDFANKGYEWAKSLYNKNIERDNIKTNIVMKIILQC